MFRLVLLSLAATWSSVICVPYAYYGNEAGPAVRAQPAFDGPAFAPVKELYPRRRQDTVTPTGNALDDNQDLDQEYNFEYQVEDENGAHSRRESRDRNGKVTGRYTIALADGRQRIVEYIADEQGFRAKVDTNEPGTDNQSPADIQWSSSASPGNTQSPLGQPPAPTPVQRPVVPVQPVPQQPVEPISSLPPQPVLPVVVPARPVEESGDEFPRTPHHPPSGFEPPRPHNRVHLAPPSPIAVSWAPSFVLRNRHSQQWSTVHPASSYIYQGVQAYPWKRK